MGYYEDKIQSMHKYDPHALTYETEKWILDLQSELRKASRQIDKLDRKLAIRSRKLGAARYVAGELAVWALDQPDNPFEQEAKASAAGSDGQG